MGGARAWNEGEGNSAAAHSALMAGATWATTIGSVGAGVDPGNIKLARWIRTQMGQ